MFEDIWKDFLTIVRDEEGSRVVETWLKAVVLEQWDVACKTVYIKAPNAFVKEWIQANYLHLFKLHLSRLFNVDQIKIIFLQAGQEEESVQQEKKIAFTPALVANNIAGASKKDTASASLVKSVPRGRARVNTHYLFSNFIVGSHNSLAFAAAHAVIEKPGQVYNPLFIYGRSGLGKTHLLHAIGNEIRAKYPKAVVLYQTADRFVNEFINAIRFDKTHQFKEKYKDVDVLLVDDIQFISNKDQTQEAFFHIFNSLYESQKQIIFSSDSFPQDIKGIAERLRSRLECGLVADILLPSIETKIAILKKKAEFNNEQLPDDVAQFIAERANSNIRELEGSLIRVMAFATLTGSAISLDLAQKVLMRASGLSENSRDIESVTLEKIAHVVGKSYAYTIKDLQSRSRSKKVSFARQVAMYLMKDMTSNPLSDIARFFNKKDHTTVVYAVQKVQQLSVEDQSFKQDLQNLKGKML